MAQSYVYLKGLTHGTDSLPVIPDNIDYAGIKELIKEDTTTGKGTIIPIPGHAETLAETFEYQLFLVFAREHDRASLS